MQLARPRGLRRGGGGVAVAAHNALLAFEPESVILKFGAGAATQGARLHKEVGQWSR